MGIEARKPSNLSLDAALVAEAKSLGINLSRAAEEGLRKAVSDTKTEAWKRENHEAIQAINAWVEENGIPLAEYRQF
jgi:antitoxin CcdA